MTSDWPAPAPTAGRRRSPIGYIATAVVALAIGAGGGYAYGHQDTDTPDKPSAAPVASTPSPSPSVTATPAKAIKGDLGEKRDTPAGALTVFGFRDNVKLDAKPDEPGTHWAAIDAEGCWTKELPPDDQGPITEMTLNWQFWSVADAGNRRYRAFTSGTTPAFLTPSYPNGEPISFGECARGWIMVPVADGAKVTTVRYKNDTDPALVWRVA